MTSLKFIGAGFLLPLLLVLCGLLFSMNPHGVVFPLLLIMVGLISPGLLVYGAYLFFKETGRSRGNL